MPPPPRSYLGCGAPSNISFAQLYNDNPAYEPRPTPIQVIGLSGRLPLVLAIAGSMPVVKGKGLTAGAWEELIKEFENSVTKMEACGEELNSLNLVLETSFNALSKRRKTNFKKMAVLAAGAVAPIEMLLNLWQTEVRCAGIPSTKQLDGWNQFTCGQPYV